MRQCHKDLSPIDNFYDGQRMELIEKQNLLLFSWLADNSARIEKGEHSDYMVGGVDEMRARYDDWLDSKGKPHNPCIPVEANEYFAKLPQCLTHSDRDTCLSDKFGSYITSLPGVSGSTYESCRQSVKEFVNDDLIMSRWRDSKACLALASATKEWGFVSAFGREVQLGHDVSKPTKWANVQTCLTGKEKELVHEAKEDMDHGFFGKAITSTMLVTVLNTLGLDPDSVVRTSEAEAANVAMSEYGLRPGWIEEC